MKKIILTLTLITVMLSGCSKDTIEGSGDTQSEFRSVAHFNKVSSEGTFEVTITQGNEQSLEIIADDNIIHRVISKVTDGKLKLYLQDGNYNNIHLQANITVTELTEVKNSGVGNMYVFDTNEVQNFKAMNSGTADIFLQGSCNHLDMNNNGSGNIYAFEMLSDNCKIYNEGAGEIEVNCTSNLDITIVGSGNVHYIGAPQIVASVEGSGEIINEN